MGNWKCYTSTIAAAILLSTGCAIQSMSNATLQTINYSMPNNLFDGTKPSTRNGVSISKIIELSENDATEIFLIPPSGAVICQSPHVDCKQAEFSGQFAYQVSEINSEGVRIVGNINLQIGRSAHFSTQTIGGTFELTSSIPPEAKVIYEGPWTKKIDSFTPFGKDFVIDLPFDSKINIRYSTRSKSS